MLPSEAIAKELKASEWRPRPRLAPADVLLYLAWWLAIMIGATATGRWLASIV